jgi:hypothetical protein
MCLFISFLRAGELDLAMNLGTSSAPDQILRRSNRLFDSSVRPYHHSVFFMVISFLCQAIFYHSVFSMRLFISSRPWDEVKMEMGGDGDAESAAHAGSTSVKRVHGLDGETHVVCLPTATRDGRLVRRIQRDLTPRGTHPRTHPAIPIPASNGDPAPRVGADRGGLSSGHVAGTRKHNNPPSSRSRSPGDGRAMTGIIMPTRLGGPPPRRSWDRFHSPDLPTLQNRSINVHVYTFYDYLKVPIYVIKEMCRIYSSYAPSRTRLLRIFLLAIDEET